PPPRDPAHGDWPRASNRSDRSHRLPRSSLRTSPALRGALPSVAWPEVLRTSPSASLVLSLLPRTGRQTFSTRRRLGGVVGPLASASAAGHDLQPQFRGRRGGGPGGFHAVRGAVGAEAPARLWVESKAGTRAPAGSQAR